MFENSQPKTIPFFIFLMTLLAGATNVYAIELMNIPVTHHTGNLSQISINFFKNQALFQQLILIVLAYSLGAFISGLFYREDGKPDIYHAYLLVIAALMMAMFKLLNLKAIIIYLVSMVAGLQNTISIPYMGMKVRITHMTGYLADLGQNIAAWSKGSNQARDKTIFLLLSILTFVLGGFLGYAISRFADFALYILAGLYLLTALYLLKIIASDLK